METLLFIQILWNLKLFQNKNKKNKKGADSMSTRVSIMSP